MSDSDEEENNDGPEWKFVWSPKHQTHYFLNSETDEKRWDNPFTNPDALKIVELHRIFKLLDVDENDELSFSELHHFLLELLTREAASEIFRRFDTDKNGSIDFDEFVNIMAFIEKYGEEEGESEDGNSTRSESDAESESESKDEDEDRDQDEDEDRDQDDDDHDDDHDDDDDDSDNEKHAQHQKQRKYHKTGSVSASARVSKTYKQDHARADLNASYHSKATGKFQSENGKIRGEGSAEARVEAKASGKAQVGDFDTAGAKIKGKAVARANAKTDGNFSLSADGIYAAGRAAASTVVKAGSKAKVGLVGQAVKAAGKARAGASASARGQVSNTEFNGSAEAFAGASANGSVGGTAVVEGRKIGSFSLSGSAHAGAGAGASAHAGMRDDGTIHFGVSAKAALIAGVGGGVNFEFNPKATGEAMLQGVKKLFQWG